MQRSAWRPDRVGEACRCGRCRAAPDGTPAGRRLGDAGPERGVRVHPLGGRRARQELQEHLEVLPGRDDLLDAHRPRSASAAGSGTSGRCPPTRRRPASRSRRPRSWRRRRRPSPAGTSPAGAAAPPRPARRGRRSAPRRGRPSGHSRANMSRISARFLWIAGTRMCEGRSSAELDDQLGQVGLVGA